MYVSADICMYDPSGISNARKRGRGKCHVSEGYSVRTPCEVDKNSIVVVFEKYG